MQGGYAFKSKDYANTGIRLVKITNVNKEHLDWDDISYLPTVFIKKHSAYSLKLGDVVIAMTRPIIKSLSDVKMAVVSEDDLPCLLNQRVGRFLFTPMINVAYFIEICKFSFFKDIVEAYASNSLQPNISSEQIESIYIPLPPLPLQHRFADFVHQVDKLKSTIQRSVCSMEKNYKSLMQKCFNHEIF